MIKINLLLGILLGILCGILTGCQTANQTVVVQHGPCGPNCAPSRARVIEREVVVVREERPSLWSSLVQVNVVPGGGCPPRGRMIHQPIMRQGCQPEWYQREWVPADRNCPPQGWGNQPWGGPPQYGGGGPSTWGDPTGRGPGGYR